MESLSQPFSKATASTCFAAVFFFLCMSFFPATAQQPDNGLQVYGIVIDDEASEPLPGASIAVLSPADSTLVTGTISNEDGVFAIQGLQPAEYLIRISFVGLESQYFVSAEHLDGTLINLQQVHMQPSGSSLDDVTVEARREAVSFERDRTVYQTDNMAAAQGASALELLDEVPSIEVDINGNISYRGSQNVVIHINGRPTAMRGDALEAYLRGIPSDIIERIETIPNPSARYDPEGIGGIINIVLKEERAGGWSGRLAANTSTMWMLRPNASVGYNTSKWNLFGTYAFGLGSVESTMFDERHQFGDDGFRLNRDMTNDFDFNNHMVNLTSEYSPFNHTTISLENQLVFWGNDQLAITSGRHISGQSPQPDYDGRSVFNRDGFFLNNTLHYHRSLNGENHTFSAEAKLEIFDYDYDSFIQQEFHGDTTENFNNEYVVEGGMRNAGLKLDYERMLPAEVKFEGGLNTEIRGMTRDMEFTDFGSEWEYDLTLLQAYTMFNRNFGRFDVEVGARAEQAFSEVRGVSPDLEENVNNDYFNLFPSASVGYALNQTNNLSLSYSKRINRPNMEALVTNYDNEDPLFRQTGNPRLMPEITHSFELAYSRFAQGFMLTVQPYLRYTTDVIRRELTVTDDGVSIYSHRNLDSRTNYGTEITIATTFFNRLRVNTSTNLYLTEVDGTNIDNRMDSGAFAWNANANVSYSFDFGLMAMVNGRYRSPVDAEFGRVESQGSLDFALRQPLMNNQLQLGLHANDILGTVKNEYRFDTDVYTQFSSNNFPSRMLMLSISFSFGGQQIPEAQPADQPMM